MKLAKMSAGFILLLLVCAGVRAQSPPTTIAVTGTLIRVAVIGGESTGWAIRFDGHDEVGSIEVKFNDPKVAERFVDKRVQVKGTVSHRYRGETGEVAVLEVTSIKGVKPAKTARGSGEASIGELQIRVRSRAIRSSSKYFPSCFREFFSRP